MLQTLVGLCALVTSTVCLIPQIWYSWRTRSTSGLSLPMLALFLGSAASWILYGIMIHDWAVVLTNVIAGLSSCFLLGLKLVFDARSGAGSEDLRESSSHASR